MGKLLRIRVDLREERGGHEDDDWDTDPDFTNDLTEAEKRAYGNRETMEKHQAVTGGFGAAIGSESGAMNTPAHPPTKMGEVLSGEIGIGLMPPPTAQHAAPTRVEMPSQIPPQMPSRVPLLVKESHVAAGSTKARTPRGSRGSVFDRPQVTSDAEVQELRGCAIEGGEAPAPVQAGDRSVQDGSVPGSGEPIRKKSNVLQKITKDATVHSFAEEECMALAELVNTKLGGDPNLTYLLPIRSAARPEVDPWQYPTSAPAPPRSLRPAPGGSGRLGTPTGRGRAHWPPQPTASGARASFLQRRPTPPVLPTAQARFPEIFSRLQPCVPRL